MNQVSKSHNMGAWAVAGGLMLGLGVGFFFLQTSALYFVGCILGGIGLGLLVAAFTGRVS